MFIVVPILVPSSQVASGHDAPRRFDRSRLELVRKWVADTIDPMTSARARLGEVTT